MNEALGMIVVLMLVMAFGAFVAEAGGAWRRKREGRQRA